jgi:hypothetical protein
LPATVSYSYSQLESATDSYSNLETAIISYRSVTVSYSQLESDKISFRLLLSVIGGCSQLESVTDS